MPAADPTAPLLDEPQASPGLGAGRVFGRYLIVERVGAGGVGEVYAAYDPNLDRRIALKVLRSGDTDEHAVTASASPGSRSVDQLVREAQALAQLSHPNVVAVHDVGVAEGRTFIAMELVDGVDLSTWLEQDPKPSWRATLKLLIEAGRGLAAAHAKQTIHRDFKPGNVLVGADRRVRVSDFGLARLLPGVAADSAEVTQELGVDVHATAATRTRHGMLVGTPYYMAPEQYAGASASVRTDIYAFCLTLHEALYGERPFPTKTVAALAAAKDDAAPSAPAGARRVPRRIRVAIERGLAPDPAKRWASMSELLAELQRDASGVYRRFVPALIVGAAGAAVASFAFTGDSDACVGAERHLDGVWDEARRVALADAFEASGLAFATQTQPRVAKALDAYAQGWTIARTQSCQATRRGEQSAEGLDRSMACLDRRLTGLRALVDVLSRGEVAAMERGVAAAQALPEVGSCLRADASTAPPTDPAVASAVAAQRSRLAEAAALEHGGLYTEALPLTEDIAAQADAIGYTPLAAEAKRRLGSALKQMGRLEDAERVLEEALWLAHGAGYSELQARIAVDLIYIVGARGAREDGGLRWARYAQAQIDNTGGDPGLRSSLANGRGMTLGVAGKYDEAEAAYNDSLAVLEDAGLSQTPRAAATIDNLGIVQRNQGHLKASIETHKRALAMREEAFGPDHPVVTRSLNNLATALNEDGQVVEAEALHTRVLELREAAYGPVHPAVATALNNLAATHYSRGQFAQAEELFRRVFEIRSEIMQGHPKTAGALSNVALVVADQGRLDEAAALYDRARELQGDRGTPRAIATTLNNIGNLQTAQGKIDDAIATYERALELLQQQLGPDHPELGLPLTNLGNLLEEKGDFDRARAMQRRSLEIRERRLGPDHPDVAWSLAGLAGTYQAAGDPAPAVPLLERALSIAQKTGGAAPLLGGIEFELGQAIAASGGDATRARALVEAARARFAKLPGREDDLALMVAWLEE